MKGGKTKAKEQNMFAKDAAILMWHTVLDITYTSRTEKAGWVFSCVQL